MNKGTRHVFAKEIREMARDKRVLQGAVVMPVFIIALFVLLLAVVQDGVTSKPNVTVAVVAGGDPRMLEQLKTDSQIESQTVPDLETGRLLVRQKEVRLALSFPADLAQAVAQGGAKVTAVYDPADPLAAITAAAFRNAIDQANTEAVRTLLAQKQINPDLAQPLQFVEEQTADRTGLAGSGIVDLLPYLIVLWAFYGGMAIVADLVAGEKERGTMETLIVSPVARAAVALGKIGALAVVCFVGSLTTLAGVVLVAALPIPLTQNLFPSGLAITPAALAAALLMLLSLVAFFSSLMVAIAAYARNIREAQTYLGLLSFVVLLPAVFSQVIGFTGLENAAWVALTPVLNVAVTLKTTISAASPADIPWPNVLTATTTSLALAALFTHQAIRLFRQEQIVLRT